MTKISAYETFVVKVPYEEGRGATHIIVRLRTDDELSGVGYFSGTCQITNGQTVIWPVVISDDTGNRIMAHNKPVTWATGDRVFLTCLIETT